MSKLILTLFTLAVAFTAAAQQNPGGTNPPQTPAASTLRVVVEQTAEKVLSKCGSWPPKLAKKQGDRTKKLTDSDLQNGTRVVTDQLAGSLSIDPNVQPITYGASFLRLLDSIGTYEPNVPNDRLLGIAMKVNPTQLNLWGTDKFVIKHDCLSMLALAGKASGGYAVPFASLDAAVSANQDAKSNQVSTFIYGILQSPFDMLYYSSTDGSQKTFAAMRGMVWRLNKFNTGNDEYVSTARMLSIDKDYAGAESTSLLGTLKAGVQIPLPSISASGTAQGGLTAALQSEGSTYITYYWQVTKRALPSMTDLVSEANRNLPKLDIDSPEVTATRVLQASKAVQGWPLEMCEPNAWNLKTDNASYRTIQLFMDKNTAASGLPECLIKVKFGLSGVVPEAPVQANYANPQLVLEHKENAAARISLNVSDILYLAGSPSVTLEVPTAIWDVKIDPTTGRKSYLEWTIQGQVEGNGRVITAVEGNNTEVTCSQNNETLSISGLRLEAVPAPAFRAKVSLTLLGTVHYNDDPTQQDKKKCSIHGSLRVTSRSQAGGNVQTNVVSFQSKDVFYPNEQPAAPPAVPAVTATAGNAQVTLAWPASATATSYKVYRGTAAGTEVLLKDGVTSTSYVDTGLTNGVAYFYQVTAANAAGESSRSVEVTATPKP